MHIREDFIQYLWQFKLYNIEVFTTTNGNRIEIIHPGLHNTNAGPDFFNAKIKIDDTLWAGNVEIHIKASDWFKHNHHTDKAYDNVILHVVLENDIDATTSNNYQIPTWVMPINEAIKENYLNLFKNNLWIPCADKILNVSLFEYKSWLYRIMIEKLENKIDWMNKTLERYTNDWNSLFYVTLLRNFGFGINGEVYEKLAHTIPWIIVQKHRDNLTILEALFLGQAGFLSNINDADEYTSTLIKEYNHLKNKYNLTQLEKHEWKFSKLRPGNFPTIRLIQIASLFHNETLTFSKILNAKNAKDLYKKLTINIHEYWDLHYYPSKFSKKRTKNLGSFAKHLIIINTFIPIVFAYGRIHDKEDFIQKSIDWLEELPPEKNSIINKWSQIYQPAQNAQETQALVYLKKNYCDHKKCLHCRIGHLVIAKSHKTI